MDQTIIRFEAISEAYADITFGFDVPVPQTGRHPAHWASDETIVAFSDELSRRAGAFFRNMLDMSPNEPAAITVSSVRVADDPQTLRRFQVEMPEGDAVEADARDFADASLVAALSFCYKGKKLGHLLAKTPGTVSLLMRAKAAHSAGPVAEGCHFSAQLRDWRIAEGASEDLTEEQCAPFEFSVVSGGYGPVALFRKGDDQYSVSMEIDEGCVAVHVQGPASEKHHAITTVRVSRDAMQANLSSGDGLTESILVGESIERLPKAEKLTQDGPAATAPSA